jgi:hypothetical protein
VLVGAGDIGLCGSAGAEATARLLDNIPGTVFTSGDNAYPSGRLADFQNCYHPSWGRHLGRTRPVPGNHEYQTAGASGYFSYFGAQAGPGALGYYSYRVGPWLILALNSEMDIQPESSQIEWMRRELANAGTPCTAAVFHRPRFSSGPNGDNPDVRELWRVLYDHGVEFIVNGHDHLYERFSPQDPDGRLDAARGIRQFTVGTGGTALYRPGARKPNSDIASGTWGVVKFTLDDGGYQWEFVPAGDATFRDSGMASCQ